MQETSTTQQLKATNQALYQQVTTTQHYLLGDYQAIDPTKSATVTDEKSKADLQTATTAGKLRAILRDLEDAAARGQPVLIGAPTIERSEALAAMLEARA